jgi:membrane protease YdiL (CAAX protease family)
MKVLSKILLILALPMFYALTQILVFLVIPQDFWALGALGSAALTAVAVFTLSKGKWASSMSFKVEASDIWNIITSVSLALSLCYLANAALSFAGRFVSPRPLLATGSFWLRLAIGATVVPVIEEIVFRGTVFAKLEESMGFGWALALQAVMFALFQQDPAMMPYGAVLGVFLALAYSWFGTLWAPVAMHAAANIFSSFAPIHAQRDLPQAATYIQAAYGLALMAICAAAILNSKVKKRKRKKVERQS